MSRTMAREQIAKTPLETARGLRELVEAESAACEEQRTLTPTLVGALWDSGLMQFMNPAEAGGLEPSFVEMLEVWMELARQDASVGWIGIANFPATAFAAALLPNAGFEEVFSANKNRVTMGGQLAPTGQGQVVDGGYRVTGNWNFGSGTGHSEYVVGGFMPIVDGAPRMDPNGLPEMLVAVFPREEISFTDGWHVTGLRGTGSFDYNVQDVFVPEQRVYPLFSRATKRGAALYRLGVMPITGAGHAAWALGVSRGALDDVIELAKTKVRMGDPSSLAAKPTFQRDLAHHEGMWRAAHRLVWSTCAEIQEQVEREPELSIDARRDLRLAATYATEASREVVQFAHLAAGTTAIRAGTRFERAFRDMYTGTQHAFISERIYTQVSELLLGLVDDNFSL